MALEMLPATGKIRELRLGVRAPVTDVRRALNLKAPFASALREIWAGQVLLADLSRADTAALAAFIESLDGRVTPFGITLAAGFASQLVGGSASASGTLAVAAAPGASTVKINISGSPTLAAGTLIGIGATAGDYQLCEVLTAGAANGSAAIDIAPRIRVPFASGTAVAAGTVTGKFTLADDAPSISFNPHYGSVQLDIIEAL